MQDCFIYALIWAMGLLISTLTYVLAFLSSSVQDVEITILAGGALLGACALAAAYKSGSTLVPRIAGLSPSLPIMLDYRRFPLLNPAGYCDGGGYRLVDWECSSSELFALMMMAGIVLLVRKRYRPSAALLTTTLLSGLVGVIATLCAGAAGPLFSCM